jgi:hypothetical protein
VPGKPGGTGTTSRPGVMNLNRDVIIRMRWPWKTSPKGVVIGTLQMVIQPRFIVRARSSSAHGPEAPGCL